MTVHDAEFRLTVYADEAMTTALTPPSGAPHSDEFKVATTTGVSGFQPYLYYPKGKHAGIDVRSGAAETSKLTAKILDMRTTEGGSNLERWVTAFVGDAEGEPDLGGHMAQWEISTDGGSSWSNYFTGRLQEPSLAGRAVMTLVVEGMNTELDADCFVGMPHDSIDYAFMSPVWPIGLTESWAGVEPKPKIPTTMSTGTVYADRLEVDDAAITGDMAQRNIVTEVFRDAMLPVADRLNLLEANEPAPGLRVIAENQTTGDSGHLYVTRGFQGAGLFGGSSGHIETERTDAGHHRVIGVGVEELPSSHPKHMPLPSDGDSVDIAIRADQEPTPEAPLLIDDVHPAKLMRDIVDGKFGYLDDDGSVRWDVPRDTTSVGTLDDHVGFANLIQNEGAVDQAFVRFRGVIEEPRQVKDFLNEPIGQAFRIGRRWNGSGELVPVDIRTPDENDPDGAYDTITNSDVDTEADPPEWRHSRRDAITMITVTTYIDEVKDLGSIRNESAEYPDLRPAQIETTEDQVRVLDVGDPSLGVKELEIDTI